MFIQRSTPSFRYLLAVTLLGSTFVLATNLVGQDTPEEPAFTPEQLEAFETNIRPLLVRHCYECHSSDSKVVKGGLLLESRWLAQRGRLGGFNYSRQTG